MMKRFFCSMLLAGLCSGAVIAQDSDYSSSSTTSSNESSLDDANALEAGLVRRLVSPDAASARLQVSSSAFAEADPCTICQGDLLVTTPCGHTFHEPCLGKWLQQKHECPMCRGRLNLNVVGREYRGSGYVERNRGRLSLAKMLLMILMAGIMTVTAHSVVYPPSDAPTSDAPSCSSCLPQFPYNETRRIHSRYLGSSNPFVDARFDLPMECKVDGHEVRAKFHMKEHMQEDPLGRVSYIEERLKKYCPGSYACFETHKTESSIKSGEETHSTHVGVCKIKK